MPCGCSRSVPHTGPKGRFTVLFRSDWKHRLNPAFRCKTLTRNHRDLPAKPQKSELTSLKFLRGKISSKFTRHTELGAQLRVYNQGFHVSSWGLRVQKQLGSRGEAGTDTLRGCLKAGGILLTRSKKASINQIWKHKPAHVYPSFAAVTRIQPNDQIKADIKSNQCVNRCNAEWATAA